MLRRIMRAIIPARPRETGVLGTEELRQLVWGIVTARPDEIVCDECFDQLDCFVELVLAGKDASEAMPLVEDHLEHCGDCCQEFEALLAALDAYMKS